MRKQKKARRTARRKTQDRPEYKYPDLEWSNERIRECQRKDESIKVICDFIEHGQLPEKEHLAREITSDSHNYVIDDGILYHVFDKKTKDTHSAKQVDEFIFA